MTVKSEPNTSTPLNAKRGIRADSPGAPREGNDAGNDSDLRAEGLRRQITSYRSAANRHMAAARKKVGSSKPRAEQLARQALDSAARAFWWAEGTEDEDRQHEMLHTFGRWTRRTFGCWLPFEGGRYSQRCPVAIAHKRIGMSPGFIADRECSICGDDLSECPHRRGRTYWVRGGSRDNRDCPVCLRAECNHSPDRLYRVSVVAIIREVRELLEVSIVERPAQPEARLTALPVANEDLRDSLGPEFRIGMPVSCDKCLRPCSGFDSYGGDRELT